MTKKDFMSIIWTVATLAVIVSVGFIGGLFVRTSQIKRQQDKIDYLNQRIGEYRNNEYWFEDYVDVLEDIYEGKINEAVLEERIYWLEKNNINYYDAEFVETLMDDVETFTEYLISYVELNGTDKGFEEWLIKNDKTLYDKMMCYDDIFDVNH